MKLNKFKKLFLSMVASSGIIAIPCIAMTSCGDPSTADYTITFNTPSGLTWKTTTNGAYKNKSITMTYTLSSGYAINADETTITCNGTSIKNSVDYRYGTVYIASKYVTGNIVINLVTKKSASYTVTYNEPDHLTWTSISKSATEDANYTASYTLDSGYAVNEETSVIKSGGNDITEYVTFGNGSILIPGNYVKGNIEIVLEIIIETDTGTHTETGGNVTVDDTTVSGLKIYTLKADTTNATSMDVTLSGTFLNSSFQISSAGTYNITLNNCKICNLASAETTAYAPIKISTKKGVTATVNFILPTNSESTINDKRTNTTEGHYAEDYVIQHTSKDTTGSLNFKGAGILNINNYNNNKGAYTTAIKTKVDVNVIEGATINAFSYDTCIQVGGKLTVEDGNIIADSYYDDAIKNKLLDPDEDLKYASNKNRDIVIKGASDIVTYSARNGISAGHDFITESNSTGSPSIKTYTNTQASSAKPGSVGSLTLDEQNMYILVPSSLVEADKYPVSDYYYTISFYSDQSGTQTITDPEYMTLKKISDDRGYFFKCDRPFDTGASHFKINLYAKAQYGSSSPTATATSGYIKIPSPTAGSNYDTVQVSNISGTSITADNSLNKNYKNLVKGDETSYDKNVGSKGIKAKNSITLNAGDITIESLDTCISCSYGDMYCNSTTAGDILFGTGNITINGGSITGYSDKGDGIKAYGEMNVTGGNVEITNSVEALEAPVLNISGGETKLYATDDGLNASTAGIHNTSSTTVNITGGILDVQTGSGDCDAIDSNNTVTITGGLLLSRVPKSSGFGSMAMSLDWEKGDISVTGTSTIVLLGKTEADHSGNPQPTSLSISTTGTKYSLSASTACATGEHTLTYYVTSGVSATYTYSNKQQMDSTNTRFWSCTGSMSIK